MRRPDQFVHPSIWAEEGLVLLPEYAEYGLASVVKPLAGYHVLISRLITLAAFKTSILWAPAIGVTLVIAFTCMVVVAIAMSPTGLRAPALCALAALLVPSDPEVLAIPFLAFWWAGLLLPLALLWNSNQPMSWLRLAFIAAGGLSSPLIVPFAALFALRATVERSRSEYVACGLALVLAILQIVTIFHSGALHGSGQLQISIPVVVNVFAGPFIATPRNWFSELQPGFIVLLFLGIAAWFRRERLTWHILLLAAAWAAACVAVAARLDVAGLDPGTVGPRYFFYPLILLIWVGIWIGAESPVAVRVMMLCGFVLSLVALGRHFVRSHEALDWRTQMITCAQSEGYDFPFHTDGQISHAWRLRLSGPQCRALIEGSLIANRIPQ